MSSIVGYVNDGRVYMASDTQITNGRGFKRNLPYGTESKLRIINGDTIISATGSVIVYQNIVSHKEWFDFDREKGLTKEFLVTKVVPKIQEMCKANNLLNTKEAGAVDTDCSLLIAWKDKLFEICQNLLVVEYTVSQALGSGSRYMLYAVDNIDREKSINDQLVDALRIGAEYSADVSAPYVLIDTKDLTMKIVEE